MDNRSTRKPPKLKLYWVTTGDGQEDWFIVAPSKRTAQRSHEWNEGYAPGDACAELVCAIPEAWQQFDSSWPSAELLEACGAVSIANLHTPGRSVHIGNRVFTEGTVLDTFLSFNN